MDARAEPQPPKTWNRAAGRIVAQTDGVASTATSLETIHSGDDHFARLLAEIRSARRSVDVEMYQVRPDRVGESVLAALASEQLSSLTWRDHPDRLPVVEALALALANIV